MWIVSYDIVIYLKLWLFLLLVCILKYTEFLKCYLLVDILLLILADGSQFNSTLNNFHLKQQH